MERMTGDKMVNSLKRLSLFLFTNTTSAGGLGMVEYHFQQKLYNFVNHKIPGHYYTYWSLGYLGFGLLNTLLTKGKKWSWRRLVDIATNTIYAMTVNDAAWWITQQRSPNIIGKTDHSFLSDYFGLIGDVLSTKVLNIPVGYYISAAIYIPYLSHNLYNLYKFRMKDNQEDKIENLIDSRTKQLSSSPSNKE